MPPTPSSSHHIKSASRQILVVLAIAIFMTAMALIILQNVLGANAPRFLKGYNQGYADGLHAARAEIGIINEDIPVTSMTAEVVSVSGNTLRVKALGLFTGTNDERSVTLAEGASITIHTPVPDKEYMRALAAYDMGSDKPMPLNFTEEEGTLQDVKVGDVISFTSNDSENIRSKKSFTVNAIVIMVPPETPEFFTPPPIAPPESTPPTPAE